MTGDTDPFVFPDMPDEAVVAIDQLLEAFHHHFQIHYFAQMHRWHHALGQREHYNDPMPSRPLDDPPF
jgi:hypothetical protein